MDHWRSKLLPQRQVLSALPSSTAKQARYVGLESPGDFVVSSEVRISPSPCLTTFLTHNLRPRLCTRSCRA